MQTLDINKDLLMLSVSVRLASCFQQVLSRRVHMTCSHVAHATEGWASCRVEALPPELRRFFFPLAFLLSPVFQPKETPPAQLLPLSPTDASPPFLLPPRAVFVYDLASGWAAS